MALPVPQAVGAKAEGLTIAPAWPAHQAGDVALLVTETRFADDPTDPGESWVPVQNSPQAFSSGGTSSTALRVFWKRAAGAAEGAPTLIAMNHIVGQIVTFRGCIATGDPWEADAGGGDVLSTASTSVAVPGGETTLADCLIVLFCAMGQDTATPQFSGWANADLANVAELADSFTDLGNGGGFGVATGEKATAGAFGVTTATAASSFAQARISLALKPPAGGGAEETATPADDVTAADARTIQVGKAVADAPTAEDARTFSVGKAAADNAEAADALAFSVGKAAADNAGAADARTFAIGKAIADAAEAADAVVFARTILIADGVTAAGEATPEEIILISEQVDDDATAADAVTFQRAIVISDTVGSADALTFARSVTAAEAVMAASAVAFAREQHFTDGVAVADEATSNAGVFADPPATRTRTRSVSGRTLTGATSGRTLAGATSGQTTAGDA